MKMNKVTKLFGIAGLTTLTALSTLGMGTMNVFADDAKLPAYIMDGTNAERAISDYFVNKADAVNENSVIIPHMDIMKSAARDNGQTVDMYGAFEVTEYVQDGRALKESGTAFESLGHFTLAKNADGTFTIAGYDEIPDNATKEDFVQVFGAGLADEAFGIYCKDANADLWKTVFAEDAAYYAYDNNLGLDKIEARDGGEIALANVAFSTNGAHTMYAQADANVRSAGTTEATAFDGIARGEEIKVTGMANGWGRVEMNGRTGYISASLLGDKKPAREEKKAEKKAEKAAKKEEKKQEAAHDDIDNRGYVCGNVESYNGSTITVNGVTAHITGETAISGTIKVGDDAKLTYVVGCDGYYTATSITDTGKLPEGVYRVSDGRVVDLRPQENAEEAKVENQAEQSDAEKQPEVSEEKSEETAVEVEQSNPEPYNTMSDPEISAPEESNVGETVLDEIPEDVA